jgi:alpha-glucosidase
MMVDPAVAYQDYPPFNDGVEVGAFMRNANGSVFQGKFHLINVNWNLTMA